MYFSLTKSTKSHLRGLSSLLKNTFRVHELFARSSAWRVRAARGKAKIGGFALSAISAIPRVRTYHTKKPSRFVHALSARPLKVQGGRVSDMCADGMEYIFFAFSFGCTWILYCRDRHYPVSKPSRTFSPWRKFSLRGQEWRRPFSCASSSSRTARPVYSCGRLNPARDNPASAR